MQTNVENLIAAGCCAVIGLTGVFVNGACTILMIRIPILRNSFGYLTAFHSLSNAILTSTYIFWVAPFLVWDFSSAFVINRAVGATTLVAQCGSYLSLFLLSLNRFVCVYKPTNYADIFSIRATIRYIVVSAILCVAYGLVYIDDSCYYIFEQHENMAFVFSETPCGQFLSDYVDYWFSIVIFAIACILDICTLLRLQWVIRKGNHTLISGSACRFKRDMRFFTQTICSTALFSMTVICYHTISLQISGRFPNFFATTFIWGLNHAGAGLIVVAFNKDVRWGILRAMRLTTTSMKVSSFRHVNVREWVINPL